jgi:acylphosphatase
MIETTKLVFIGRFRRGSFLDFMRHRATRLALCARPELVHDDIIEVSVSGESDLVDAFELACSLGPIDCLVRDHHRERPSKQPVSAGCVDIELRRDQ